MPHRGNRRVPRARSECEFQLVPCGPARALAEEEAEALRQATRTGRPCGDAAFVRELEGKLARPLAPQKRGPKPQASQAEEIPELFDD